MARAAPKYPREIRELAWTEHLNGTGPVRILEMIRAGSLPGIDQAYDMTTGAWWDIWRKVKATHDPALRPIKTQEEFTERLDALDSSLLITCEHQAKRLRRAESQNRFTTQDATMLVKMADTAAKLRRRLAASPATASAQERAAEAKQNGTQGMHDDATRTRLREIAGGAASPDTTPSREGREGRETRRRTQLPSVGERHAHAHAGTKDQAIEPTPEPTQ